MSDKLLTWREVCPGGTVTEAGSSAEYRTGTWRTERPVLDAGSSLNFETGDWRSDKPIWDGKKCTHCMICWVYCPDATIIVENGRWVRFDYEHCKGCGICAQTCPVSVKNPHAVTGQMGKVIQMIPESD
jgi:pyruvate ferredoxin oxidoreductase delta subunit